MSSTSFELKNIVVRAGAGAGKTTELTQRVLSLAEAFEKKHQRYPRLMVTTFTRKATQELKERLLKKAMELNNPDLVRFVKSPSRLHISTIHGILSLFLNKYGTAIGLSPKFSIISAKKNQVIVKKKIRELCQSDMKFNDCFQTLLESTEFSDLLEAFSQFSDHQIEFSSMQAADSKDFMILLEQKSRLLLQEMNRYCHEIRKESLPEAWQNLAAYFERYLQIAKDASQISDWSQFWVEVESEIPQTKKTKDMGEYWSEQKKKISKEILSLTDWNCQISFWKEHQTWVQDFAFCAVTLSKALYEEKISRAELTMQDLEVVSLRLMRERPDIAQAFAKTCDYWFIDEFQDTSPIQVELLKGLSHQSSSYIVGDPQQSIYLFRGARSEVFNDREKLVESQGGELLKKMVNYRSQPELLEFFNHFFTELSPQFQKMQPKSDVVQGSGDPVAEVLVALEDDDDETNDAELLAVVFRCQELIGCGVKPEEICVLSRNNQDLEKISHLAKMYHLPVQRHSSGQFFERREIRDACSLLKFLCNPHDNINFLEVLRSPAFYVEDQVIYEQAQKSSKSFWSTFKILDLEPIRCLSTALQEVRTNGLGVTWREHLVDRGYFKVANAMDFSGQREANLWKLVHLILTKERMSGFSHLEFLNSLDLSSNNTEEQDQGDGVPVVEPSKVHLMTVHASKGLQFDHVIFSRLGKDIPNSRTQFYMLDDQSGKWTLALPDPEEGKKVSSLLGKEILKKEKERTQAESDRILYVAMTRAKCSVSLIMGEKHDANSWAARWPLDRNEGIHQKGLFAYRVRHQKFKPISMQAQESVKLEPIESFQFDVTGKRQTISVTSILEMKSKTKISNKESDSKDSAIDVAGIEKAMSGVEMHRLFESLKYFMLNDSEFDWKELLPDLSDSQKKALQFLAQDQEGKWIDVVRNGEVEDGIAVFKSPYLIQGQIDLWGRDQSGQAWVVDYKTGSERYREKAFSQLEIYTWALRKMKKIKQDEVVQLAVIYPLSQKTYIKQSQSFAQADGEVSDMIRK